MALKYYSDPDLKIQIKPLYLGKLKAGEKKQYTFYVYNDNIYPIEEIKFSFDNKNLKILEAPTEMKEKEKAKIIIERFAPLSIKQTGSAKLYANYYDSVRGI